MGCLLGHMWNLSYPPNPKPYRALVPTGSPGPVPTLDLNPSRPLPSILFAHLSAMVPSIWTSILGAMMSCLQGAQTGG